MSKNTQEGKLFFYLYKDNTQRIDPNNTYALNIVL